jgi:membrane-bound ClpP family serine protease
MLRPVRLARIAAEAETLRLRGLVSRIATRAALAAVALVFLLAVLVFVHIAIWYALITIAGLSFLVSTGIVGGADLVIAIILGLVARSSTPSETEAEALDVRRRAIQGLPHTLSVSQMMLPVLEMAATARQKKQPR